MSNMDPGSNPRVNPGARKDQAFLLLIRHLSYKLDMSKIK